MTSAQHDSPTTAHAAQPRSAEARRMPAVFIGHGSPMNTLESNRYTTAWREFGASIAKPAAVLAVSAHWYTRGTGITAMTAPRTIHDFGGFPDELFAVQYPAPGDPELAQDIADIVKPTHAMLDDQWGLDHGTWSVLVHVLPDADVPVLQLSIDATKPTQWHVELGARLAPLRDRGVLIVGSGNVVHNLGAVQWGRANYAEPWALDFDNATREVMRERPSDLGELEHHAAFAASAPTPEHFLPLAYIAGLASDAGEHPEVFVEGSEMGSLTMTSFRVG
jgi:4,5-DOPA dioxygenase extradiol